MSIRIFNSKSLEVILLMGGLALTGFAAVQYVGGKINSRGAIERFHSGSAVASSESHAGVASLAAVDFGLWSPKRVNEYKATLAEHFDQPLAVLRMDKIHLEVPVFEGTSERVLNRGAGRIEGTAQIGVAGNVGIAGHRDGFFRGLKDVSVGDKMELQTASGKQIYVIDSIKLVERNDVSVLQNQGLPEITLVTCFPFYFIGSAPQRYIVHASLNGEMKTLNESEKASSQATASSSKENTQ